MRLLDLRLEKEIVPGRDFRDEPLDVNGVVFGRHMDSPYSQLVELLKHLAPHNRQSLL